MSKEMQSDFREKNRDKETKWLETKTPQGENDYKEMQN